MDSRMALRQPLTLLPGSRFLGVWDTVGALGLPGPFREEQKVFGFNDSLLGDHIERACQALALNETRQDFVRLLLLHR